MCGRYYVPADEAFVKEIQDVLEGIEEKYGGTPEREKMKSSGEVFPTDIVPIVTADGPELASWGFPSMYREKVVMNPRRAVRSPKEDINAKVETVLSGMDRGRAAAKHAYWQDDIYVRRIAIPTGGFFEWPHNKTMPYGKYLFKLPEGEVLYLAGLFRYFPGAQKGMERRVVILTTQANASVKPYHHRMPVLLRKEEVDAWLNDASITREILERTPPQLEVAPFGASSDLDRDVQLSMFD